MTVQRRDGENQTYKRDGKWLTLAWTDSTNAIEREATDEEVKSSQNAAKAPDIIPQPAADAPEDIFNKESDVEVRENARKLVEAAEHDKAVREAAALKGSKANKIEKPAVKTTKAPKAKAKK